MSGPEDEDDDTDVEPVPDGLPTKPPPPPPPGARKRRRLSVRPEEDFEITDRGASAGIRGSAASYRGQSPTNLEIWTLR